MRIEPVNSDKKKYLDLLLLADEQEEMIDRYLEDSKMYVLIDSKAKGVCVVTDNGNGIFEIKNIAVAPDAQGRGYGRQMIEHVKREYCDQCKQLLVGTGDSSMTIPFYEKNDFTELYRIKNFFTDNYNHPIFESGKQLIDLVVLCWVPDEASN